MSMSLNAIWSQFVQANEAAYAADDPDQGFALTTRFALRLPDGTEATGTLCVSYFDNDDWQGPQGSGHVGVQLDLDTLKDEEGGAVLKDENGKPLDGSNLIDIMPPITPWTKEQLELVFNINPDSPIWEREHVSVQ
jgi:hypothetical protein